MSGVNVGSSHEAISTTSFDEGSPSASVRQTVRATPFIVTSIGCEAAIGVWSKKKSVAHGPRRRRFV
jgi:hypothetical protein